MIRASSILFWFGLTICASLALYHTSDRANELSRQLRALDASVESEQQNIHVLKAEWAYLSNPARVEAQAKKHLALRPTVPAQVVAMADLDDALPAREQTVGPVAVNSAPIASVKTSLAASARKLTLAADHTHINDHIVIRHTASADLPSSISSLIAGLGTHPWQRLAREQAPDAIAAAQPAGTFRASLEIAPPRHAA